MAAEHQTAAAPERAEKSTFHRVGATPEFDPTRIPRWAQDAPRATRVHRCSPGGDCCDDCRAQRSPFDISDPHDTDEREAADISAEAIEGGLPPTPIQPTVDAGSVERAHDDSTAQPGGPAVSHPLDGLGSGQPLSQNTKETLRPRLAVDVDDVRVHTGGVADRNARALGAQAYTVGRDIVFADGRYDPGSREGMKLLAHEVTHVGQQAPGRAARTVHRDDDLPKAPSNFLVPTVGSTPSISVDLTKITFSFADTTNRFVKGDKRQQAAYLAVRALLGGSNDTEFIERVVTWDIGLGREAHGLLHGTADENEMVPLQFQLRDGLRILKKLKSLNKPLALTERQVHILELGEAAQFLVEGANDPAFDTESLGPTGHHIPKWFTKPMQMAMLHEHGALLETFAEAYQDWRGNQADQDLKAAMIKAAVPVILELIKPAEILDVIRADATVTDEPGYQVLWPTRAAMAALGQPVAKEKKPPIAPAEAPPAAQLGTSMLAFLWTQQNVWTDLRTATNSEAHRKVLQQFFGWIPHTIVSTPAAEGLYDKPVETNMPALPARMSTVPEIGPPNYDASVKSDYHFTMDLSFPDVFEHFAQYRFTWIRRKIAEKDLKEIAPDPAMDTPTGGEVAKQRFAQTGDDLLADGKRLVSSGAILFGNPMVTVPLAGAATLMRLVSTGFSLGAELLLSPASEKTVAFGGPGLGTGLYIITCIATPVIQGQGFVRAPSVAWIPVIVRSPQEIGEQRIDAVTGAAQKADERLDDLNKQLADPAKKSDYKAIQAEIDDIKKSKGSLDDALQLRLAKLQERMSQIAAGDPAQPGEYLALIKQIDAVKSQLKVRGKRAGDLGAKPERITAVLVTDKGSVLTLAVEAALKETADDPKHSETWYLSDVTTPKSDDATRTGDTKAEAIEKALRAILEGIHGYGRGSLTFAVDGVRKTIRIEKSLDSIAMDAVEDLATLASIAAVAAAPFTGGASLSLLIPIGVIGAVPAAYRIASVIENGTMTWDLAFVSDLVAVAAGIAGLGQVARGMQMIRLARGLMVMGVAANGLGIIVMGVGIAEQLDAVKDLPPGLRMARASEIIGKALVNIGIMVGATLAEKAASSEYRKTLTDLEGANQQKNRTASFESWLGSLEPDTRKKLKALPPEQLEVYSKLDPETRRMLTMCGSDCIPIPPPSPEYLAKLNKVMDDLGMRNDQNLREFLHDQRARGQLEHAIDTLAGYGSDKVSAQRLFDAAITAWAAEKGMIATKVDGRWQAKRADGVIIKEWTVGDYATLRGDFKTKSYFQAHHGVQDAWSEGRKIRGYDPNDCPTILLRDSYAGSPHQRITARQAARAAEAPTRTYAQERANMIEDLKIAEVPQAQIDALVAASDKYFGGLRESWIKSLGNDPAKVSTHVDPVFGAWPP